MRNHVKWWLRAVQCFGVALLSALSHNVSAELKFEGALSEGMTHQVHRESRGDYTVETHVFKTASQSHLLVLNMQRALFSDAEFVGTPDMTEREAEQMAFGLTKSKPVSIGAHFSRQGTLGNFRYRTVKMANGECLIMRRFGNDNFRTGTEVEASGSAMGDSRLEVYFCRRAPGKVSQTDIDAVLTGIRDD